MEKAKAYAPAEGWPQQLKAKLYLYIYLSMVFLKWKLFPFMFGAINAQAVIDYILTSLFDI